jgi:hypothetical protein
MDKSTIVKCDCYSHLLEHSYDAEDKTHYVSFWTHGVHGEKLTWKRRLKAAWNLIRGKNSDNFWGVILTPENAQKIADSINEANEKSLG